MLLIYYVLILSSDGAYTLPIMRKQNKNNIFISFLKTPDTTSIKIDTLDKKNHTNYYSMGRWGNKNC